MNNESGLHFKQIYNYLRGFFIIIIITARFYSTQFSFNKFYCILHTLLSGLKQFRIRKAFIDNSVFRIERMNKY